MNGPLYKIANWHELYESKDSSRTAGPMKWIPVVTKTDGFGFGLLRQEKNRPELLAAWHLMLGVAAKQPRELRGSLMRDGVPLTADDLELMTGFPARIFSEAFAFFTQPKQGWLVKDDMLTNRRNLPQNAADCALQDRTVEEKTGQDTTEQESAAVAAFPVSLQTDAFSAAWGDWIAYRRERRLPVWKARTVTANLAEMAAWGEPAAIQAIRDSIRNGWQGVFPPKTVQAAGQPARSDSRVAAWA